MRNLPTVYAAGKPLTRPEVGVLLSYAKIVLFNALAASDLPDDSYFRQVLLSYFRRPCRSPTRTTFWRTA